jgi:hypothetical protein
MKSQLSGAASQGPRDRAGASFRAQCHLLAKQLNGTRPFDRIQGDAAWAIAGAKPITTVSALFFAAAGDFFAGVQGDKNAESVTFCHPLWTP